MALTTLLALSILAQRRGGSDDGASPVTKVRTKLVTTDYFRKNDPAFLGALRQLSLPRGRTFLLPGERRFKIDAPPLKPMDNPGGGSDDGGFKPLKLYPMGGLDYAMIAKLLEPKTFNASFGELPPGSGPKTGWYHTVASKNGVMTIGAVMGVTPISIAKVETFTGKIKDGEPEVESTIVPNDGKKPLKVPISAGQGYRVAYTFDPTNATPGTYIKDTTIDDGHLTTMHFYAKVVAEKSYLNIDVDPKPMALTAGKEAKQKISITAVTSNASNPTVKLSIANASALSAAGITASVDDSVLLGVGKKATATLRVKADDDILDTSGTIMVQVSEAGKAVTTFPVAYETTSAWVDGEVVQDYKGLHLDAKFRYNSSGAWVYTGSCKNDSGTKMRMYSILYFGALVNGKHYGIDQSPDIPAGNTNTWVLGGNSQTIRDHFQEFASGDVYAAISDTQPADMKTKNVHKFAKLSN